MDTELPSSSMKGFRLPKEGKALFEKFFTKTSKYPTYEQKLELLRQIRELPRCKDYTKQKVDVWFNARRAKDNKQMEKGKAANPTATVIHYVNGTHKFLYPSIPADKLTLLDEVYEEHIKAHRAEPTDAIIELWAESCGEGVTLKHVGNWVRRRNALESASNATADQAQPSSQLPTPSQSTSPEPGPSNYSAHNIKNEPPMSPVIDRAPLQTGVINTDFDPEEYEARLRQRSMPAGVQLPLSPVSPSFPDNTLPTYLRQPKTDHPVSQAHAGMSSISQYKSSCSTAPQKPPLPPLPKDLLPRLAAALSSRPSPQTQPKTLAEFEARFQPHETKMRNFMTQVSNGHHQMAGWDPSLVAPPRAPLLPPTMSILRPSQSNVASSSNMSS